MKATIKNKEVAVKTSVIMSSKFKLIIGHNSGLYKTELLPANALQDAKLILLINFKTCMNLWMLPQPQLWVF